MEPSRRSSAPEDTKSRPKCAACTQEAGDAYDRLPKAKTELQHLPIPGRAATPIPGRAATPTPTTMSMLMPERRPSRRQKRKPAGLEVYA